MTSPDDVSENGFAFDEGQRLGRSWVLRAATADQVKELLVGSLDPVHSADWDTEVDLERYEEDAGQFRAGFNLAVGEVVAHLRRFRDGAEPWAYEELQPDAVGVLIRLRAVLERPPPPVSPEYDRPAATATIVPRQERTSTAGTMSSRP
jgi:hypothetical protein